MPQQEIVLVGQKKEFPLSLLLCTDIRRIIRILRIIALKLTACVILELSQPPTRGRWGFTSKSSRRLRFDDLISENSP